MARKKVVSRVGISDEAITEVVGIDLEPFITDPSVMFDACAKADTYFQKEFGLSVPPRVPCHGWWTLPLLGVQVDEPENGWPHPLVCLERAENVDRLTMPEGDYMAHPSISRLVEYDKAVCAVTGRETYLHDGVPLGPVTFCRTLRGDDFFLDLYESPEHAHKLLDFAADYHIEFQSQLLRYCGGEVGELMHIADDFAGMISPAMWDEFVIPYWKRIFEKRGVQLGYKIRMLHSELMNPEQQMIAVRNMPINAIECGEDPNVTVDDMNATGLDYWWHIKAMQMYNGTPEEIRDSFRDAAEKGATTIITGLTLQGIPPANVHAFLDVAREYE